jgi:serine/threonine-protein kinase
MVGEPSDEAQDCSLHRARRVNQRCEEFEAQWRAGSQPCIAAYLDLEASDAAGSITLFRELVALEVELRQERGERPAAAEYVAQFPDQRAQVLAVFSELETAAATARGGEALAPFPGARPPEVRRAPRDSATQSFHPAGAPGAGGLPPTIGEYELVEEIARGGMGVVYKARHKGLKRLVALKMILSGSLATTAERERFRREAELAANLDHPNIVPIYDVDEHQGRPFFTMKLVDGASLAKNSAQKGGDPRSAARLVSTLARAVDYAHAQRFLHCDLKPSNVLLDRQGNPYLTDFGLARRAGVESSLSISGGILGTPSYMAPEQATGSRTELGPSTDVYGLGAILYEVLTGRPPFRAETVMETVVQVLEREPAPPRELRPEIPKALESVCLKCLEKSPRDRYPSAGALADDLDRYHSGEGIEATGVLARFRRWNRREPELVARVGGLALVAILTQYNYWFVTATRDFRIHYLIQAVLLFWAVSAAVFQCFLRRGWNSDRVRVVWSACDVLLLTMELWLLGRVETTLLAGYPLLIAASGLWWRVHLVWVTTALAMLGFGALYLGEALRWPGWQLSLAPVDDLRYANIFLAALLLTGYVVARQVKRILALGRYYEQRPEV